MFKLINTRVQKIYGNKWGNNAKITAIYKYETDDKKHYDLFYKTDKGTYLVSTLIKDNENSI